MVRMILQIGGLDDPSKIGNPLVTIYDRYGKAIKRLYPNDVGWDGLYQLNEMPERLLFRANYFDLELNEPVEIKGHFSLLR